MPGVLVYLYSPLKSDMDYRIFNVCTDVNAWKCMVGGKSLAAPGTEPAAAVFQSDALPTELHALTYFIPSCGMK